MNGVHGAAVYRGDDAHGLAGRDLPVLAPLVPAPGLVRRCDLALCAGHGAPCRMLQLAPSRETGR